MEENMRKRVFTMAMVTMFALSACGNRTEGSGGNITESMELTEAEGLTDGMDPAGETVAPKEAEPEELRAGAEEQDKSVTVMQEGNAGTLQVVLPEGWTYEACPEGSDQLRMGEYGIHFYPEAASEGFIELGYVEFFGVCGTGLEEEKVTLAGDEANIGTYDNGSNWDFVAFRGANKGIVAQTYEVESWWPEYEEQVLEILDTVCLKQDQAEGTVPETGTASGGGAEICGYPLADPPADSGITTIACGTDQEPEKNLQEDSCIEELGLSLEITEHTGTGATLVFRQSGGNPTGELQYGSAFSLERYEEEAWVPVPVAVEGNYAFTEEAYNISKDADREFQIDWGWLYGELEPGAYRIIKSVDDFRKTGDYDQYNICAYFEIHS